MTEGVIERFFVATVVVVVATRVVVEVEVTDVD
jgi:hypothetical protein